MENTKSAFMITEPTSYHSKRKRIKMRNRVEIKLKSSCQDHLHILESKEISERLGTNQSLSYENTRQIIRQSNVSNTRLSSISNISETNTPQSTLSTSVSNASSNFNLENSSTYRSQYSRSRPKNSSERKRYYTSNVNLIFCTIILLLTKCLNADLFSHSSPQVMDQNWPANTQKTQLVSLGFDLPLFGEAVDLMWLSRYGTISYDRMIGSQTVMEDIDDNIVLSPYFLTSLGGKLKWERLSSPNSELTTASDDVNSYDSTANFAATSGLLVTWENVKSAQDTALKNQFQAFLVTDGVSSYVIYNYDKIEFTQSIAGDAPTVGAFAISEDQNTCLRVLNTTATLDVDNLTSSSNCGTAGKWIMRLHEKLTCLDTFQTACGDEPQAGEWTVETGYFENTPEKWDFFVRYECKSGLEIAPNVTIEDSYCLYDPDYYESKWSCTDPPKCQDFTVAKKFEITMTITEIQGENINNAYREPVESGYEDFRDEVHTAIHTLFTNVGLGDNEVTALDIDKASIPALNRQNYNDDEFVFVVDIDFLLPTTTRDTATEEDIIEAVKEYISHTPTVEGVTFTTHVAVKEKTDACLEICLGCKNPNGCLGPPPLIPPNKCCGTCTNGKHEGGIAYSTSTHACCNDEFIYDPAKYVCCPKDDGPSAGFFKHKGLHCDVEGFL